jgi:hypothetical protein
MYNKENIGLGRMALVGLATRATYSSNDPDSEHTISRIVQKYASGKILELLLSYTQTLLWTKFTILAL